MKMRLLILSLALILSGCSTTPRSSMTSADLSDIKKSVVDADVQVIGLQAVATNVQRTGAAPEDPRVIEINDGLRAVRKHLAMAGMKTIEKQQEVNAQTKVANDMADRLNYIEPKYAASVKLLWKERLHKFIAFGIIGALIAMLLCKSWLKTQFPWLFFWL